MTGNPTGPSPATPPAALRAPPAKARPLRAQLLKNGVKGATAPLRVQGRALAFLPNGKQGFALVVVLWTIALLALLTSTLLADARTEAKLTLNRRDEAIGVAAADAAISATILDLLRPGLAAGAPRRVGPATVSVSLENLSGRMNPNIVSALMLNALIQRLGVSQQAAEALAAAIVDWRTPGLNPSPHGAKAAAYRAAGLSYGPPGRPFEHLDELGAVLGMTPSLLAALTPHLTLWSTTDPDPAYADAMVLDALRLAGVQPVAGGQDEAQVVAITATATLPEAPVVSRRAIVRFGYSPDGRGWRVLDWDGGEAGSR